MHLEHRPFNLLELPILSLFHAQVSDHTKETCREEVLFFSEQGSRPPYKVPQPVFKHRKTLTEVAVNTQGTQ